MIDFDSDFQWLTSDHQSQRSPLVVMCHKSNINLFQFKFNAFCRWSFFAVVDLCDPRTDTGVRREGGKWVFVYQVASVLKQIATGPVEQFLQVGRLDRALILRDLALSSQQASRIRSVRILFLWRIRTYANVFYFSVCKQEQNTLQLQHSSLTETVAKKVNKFPGLYITIVALNQAVLYTSLQQHRYVTPLVTFRTGL